MNPDIKSKWLEALRSGKYRQGKGVLRSEGNCFCALGVLCDVVDPSGWGEETDEERVCVGDSILDVEAYSYRGDSTSLSISVRELTGISDEAQSSLIHINDNQGKTFAQIADYVEKHL